MILVLCCAAIFPLRALAQEESAAASSLAQAGELISASAARWKTRYLALEREARVLKTLADAATSISGPAGGTMLSRARQKLNEAQNLVQTEPALGEPTQTVLGSLNSLLGNTALTGDQLRGQLFLALAPLEDHILQEVTILRHDAETLRVMEVHIFSFRSGLDAGASSGIAALQYVRRLAVR